MLQVITNQTYKYTAPNMYNKIWGTVLSFNKRAGTCEVKLAEGSIRTFGLYEVENWIRQQIIVKFNNL